LAFFAQTTASFSKKFIITLDFEKNANFIAQNCIKLAKIVINTLGFEKNANIIAENRRK
jgi:hypothetical protein